MTTPADIGPHEIEGSPVGDVANTIAIEKKEKERGNTTTTAASQNVEFAPAEEPEKTYFSKASVWLMILFSGLAIGSDG